MRAYTRRRLTTAAKLGAATIPFAVLLRWSDPEALVRGSVLLGFAFGFLVGVTELFLVRDWFGRMRFIPHLIAKSSVLLLVMYATFAILNVLDVAFADTSWRDYFRSLLSFEVLFGLLVALGVIAFLLFFVHLDRLLGPGVLAGYLMGRYHRPRQEDRIFMFLDLKGSTALAEAMEDQKYFGFLQRYFAVMSEPILETDAEIYQYVGDEIVLTWPLQRGLEDAACVRVFFLIERSIADLEDLFRSDFGVVPEFKAGVHAGSVVAAQIGELKSEVVYSGDVLNTTARIQAQCNRLGHRLLVSRALVEMLDLGAEYTAERLDSVQLRGKEEPQELCAIYQTGVPPG